MTIGFDISPKTNKPVNARYRRQSGCRAYQQYAMSVAKKKNAHRTFFRSATQATDSTLMG